MLKRFTFFNLRKNDFEMNYYDSKRPKFSSLS